MKHIATEPQVISGFTPGERMVISSWLARTKKFRLRNLSNATAEHRPLADALASLGLEHEAKQYDRLDAAVGQILLRDIAHRLPRLRQWRDCRSRYAGQHRRLNFAPQHLFTITWPSQTPGLRGPVAYHRVWMPAFERFVVTASEPTDAPHGYCDFALGSFADVPHWATLTGEIIYNDWRAQFGFWSCKHRAEVSSAGVIAFDLAEEWADQAWTAEHRVYYSKQLTPRAPRAAVAKRKLITNPGSRAMILAFPHRVTSGNTSPQETT
jgi:hypothetical protein